MAEDLLYDAVVLACHQANARIWVFTPYFLPTPNLTQALSIAAGVGWTCAFCCLQNPTNGLQIWQEAPHCGCLVKTGFAF